jgi:chromosome segregation ATPase
MKMTILKAAYIGFGLLWFTQCTSHEKKIENAKEDVVEAQQKLDEARRDSTEYVRYQDDVQVRLTEYDMKIENLKQDMKNVGKDMKASYQESINAMQAKSEDLKARLHDYKKDASNSWETFKFNFNKEMDELGESISATAEKNMKKADPKKH